MPLTYVYTVRGAITGCRRPLRVRGRRIPGRCGPRTGAEQATDGGGGSGCTDRPPGLLTFTWYFRIPARYQRLPHHRSRTRGRPLSHRHSAAMCRTWH